MSDQRAKVKVPRVPTLPAIIEFLIGMSTGDVEKGGSREARDKEWYASPAWGLSQVSQRVMRVRVRIRVGVRVRSEK